MKLTTFQVGLVGIIFLALICFGSFDFEVTNRDFNISLPKSGINWVENYVDGAIPLENSFIGCFIKAGLAPTPYHNFFAIRPVPPVWEKTLPEYVSFAVDFFRPIMVLIIFLFFYQSSRNSAGLDH